MDKDTITMLESENPVQQNITTENQDSVDRDTSKMKKCPFCAEYIQLEAIKCRYCGEFLQGFGRKDVKAPSNKKWYYSTAALIGMLAVLGPLAIPAVWVNPRYKVITKAIITIAVILVTILLVYLMVKIYANLLDSLMI